MSAAPYPGRAGSCNGLAAGSAGQGFFAGADPTEPTNPRFFGDQREQHHLREHGVAVRDDARDRRAAVGQMIVH